MHSVNRRVPDQKVDPLYGWVVVAAGTAIIVIINGTFYSYGVFFKPLLQEFNWTRAELSGPVSLRLMASGIFGIIVGAVVDRAGPRWVVLGGIFLVAVGNFFTAKVSDIWHMYLTVGLLSGVGMSAPFPAIVPLVSRWFTRKRGLATGIVLGGYGIGQIIFPPLITHWIASYSWRTTFVIMALIVGLVGIPLGLLLKLPDKGKSQACAEGSPRGRTVGLDQDIVWTFKDSIKSLPLWQISFIYFLFSICLQALMVHLVPHAIDIGIDPLAASILLTVVGVTNVIGRIIGGGFSDKLGTKRALIVSFVMPGLMLPALIFAKSLFWLYPIAAIYGIGYGGISSTVPKLTAEYYGLGSLGALLGVIQLAFAAGGAVGGPLAGYIFDTTNSYVSAFVMLSILLVVAFVLCLSLHPPGRPVLPEKSEQ